MSKSPSAVAVSCAPPTRVLVVAETADRSERALYAGLRQAGLQLDLLVDPATPNLPAIRAAIPDVGTLRVRCRFDPQAAWALRRRLRTAPPDVVYAPINGALSVALLATCGSRIPVVSYRGTLGRLRRADPAGRATGLHPRLRHIVCASDAVYRHLREDVGVPASRLTRIYQGHDPAWYAYVPVSPLDLGEFGVPYGATLVGFAGTARPAQGTDVLAQALAHLPPQVHLLLIGDLRGRRMRRALRCAPRPWHVHVTGFRTDVLELMQRCDVMVMPSVASERLPRAAIEAMALGRPVVVTRVGELPELVQDGINGLIAEPGDAVGLAAALGCLLDDPARAGRLGAAARASVAERFHIRAAIEAYAALFRELQAQTAGSDRR